MVSVAWSSSGAALYSHHECALSQVGACPNMTLDVDGTKKSVIVLAVYPNWAPLVNHPTHAYLFMWLFVWEVGVAFYGIESCSCN